MSRIKEALFEHRLALVLALLVSLITLAPQAYFRFEHRHDGVYQGIELIPDSPWSPRVREVQDGHPNFGAIYYQDGKDLPYLFQPLGSITVAYLGKIFGLDINNTLLLSRLILPALVFLLIYAFVYLYLRDKLVALASASLLLLADSVMSLYGLEQMFKILPPDSFLRIARPVNPAMIYVLLFGFLASFWHYLEKREVKYGLLATLLLGLNFYNYFYSWTLLYAFGALLTLLFWFSKRKFEAKRVFWVFAGAVIFLIPYALNMYHTTLHPNYADTSLRFGVVETHAPIFIGVTALIALALYLWKFPREQQEKFLFGLALLLTPILTLNQQILTGKVLQASHYHWFFHKPLAVILSLFVLFYLLSRSRFHAWRKPLGAALILGSLFTGVFVQAVSYQKDTRDGGQVMVERQKYGPVMDWLSSHAEKEAVVFANGDTSYMVAIYTPLNLFYHRAGMYTLAATKERLYEEIFAFYRLRGVGADQAREVFFKERGFISWNVYGMHYRETLGDYDRIPDEQVEEALTEYLKTLSTPTPAWFKEILSKYHVSYLVWDKKTDPEWKLERFSFLEKQAELGDLAIYKVK